MILFRPAGNSSPQIVEDLFWEVCSTPQLWSICAPPTLSQTSVYSPPTKCHSICLRLCVNNERMLVNITEGNFLFQVVKQCVIQRNFSVLAMATVSRKCGNVMVMTTVGMVLMNWTAVSDSIADFSWFRFMSFLMYFQTLLQQALSWSRPNSWICIFSPPILG